MWLTWDHVSEIRDGDVLWQWSLLEISLNAFRRSTIPQKQLIIIIIIIIIITIIIIIISYEEKIFLKQGKLLSTEYFTWFPKNISEASCRHFFEILFTHAKNVIALILTRREQGNCAGTVAPRIIARRTIAPRIIAPRTIAPRIIAPW